MSKNIYPYPCTDCPKKEKCYILCKPYSEWFKEEWQIVTEPFRRVKRERDERKANE